MKSLKNYFQKAYKEHWAIGQFNFSDFSQEYEVSFLVLGNNFVNYNIPTFSRMLECLKRFYKFCKFFTIRRQRVNHCSPSIFFIYKTRLK